MTVVESFRARGTRLSKPGRHAGNEMNPLNSSEIRIRVNAYIPREWPQINENCDRGAVASHRTSNIFSFRKRR